MAILEGYGRYDDVSCRALLRDWLRDEGERAGREGGEALVFDRASNDEWGIDGRLPRSEARGPLLWGDRHAPRAKQEPAQGTLHLARRPRSAPPRPAHTETGELTLDLRARA